MFMTAHFTTYAVANLSNRLRVLLAALLVASSAFVSAQSTEDDAGSPALHEVMKATNEGYAESVVIPALRRFFSSAMFLEGVSSVFDANPDIDTLVKYREQLAETTFLRGVISNFDFGPIHSLGYAAAMDTRLDEGGLAKLLANDVPDHSLLISAASKPWFQGFEALHYLLDDNQDSKQVEDYTYSERLYLNLLASRLRQTARSLLESWSNTTDGYPAYYTALSTAGDPGNHSYMTVHAASEEIIRGVINALDVVANESLPNIISSDSPVDADHFNETLTYTRAVLLGAISSYSGQLVGLKTNMSQIVPTDGAGLGRWISSHDPKLGDFLHTQLLLSFASTGQLIEEIGNYNTETASRKLEGLHETISQLLSALESQALPLTRLALATN